MCTEPNQLIDNDGKTYIKYDKQSIPPEFICNNDVLIKLNELVVTLEQNQNNQAYADGVYNSFTTDLDGEMKKKNT